MSGDAGYFDLQVNGYGGIDFNKDGLTAEELHRACERLDADGVGGFLATIITEQLDLMCGRLADAGRASREGPARQAADRRPPHRGPVHQRGRRLPRRPPARRDPSGRRGRDGDACSTRPAG